MASFVCASHGHCFDGLASAALLTDIIEHGDPGTRFTYRALGYGPTPPRVEFSGKRNALLDYKYIPDPSLTLYLDHHPTAFSSAAERAHFEGRRGENEVHFVHDVGAPSCANLVAGLARTTYGLERPLMSEIEAFAQKIDSAQFDSVDEAIDTDSSSMKLVTAVTHFGDHQFYQRAVPILRREGVHGLAEQRWVKEQFRKLTPAIRLLNERIRKNGKVEGRVALVNLLDRPTHVVSKFRQYYEFPHATYSVMLLRMQDNLRISVGYNPWSGRPCDVNIGRLCQTYGGGGHAVVGAIGLSNSRESDAQSIAETIARKLQEPESDGEILLAPEGGSPNTQVSAAR